MDDFGNIQSQMANQMQQQQSQKELNEAARDLSQAARELSSTNQNQLMQMQMQSQQTQQLSNSVRTLSSTVQTGSQMPPPAPGFSPIMAPAMSFAGGMVKNRAEEYRNNMTNFYSNMRFGQSGTFGGQPGYLGVQNNGAASALFHGAGFTFNPANSQNYTYGAYQRAHANNFGSNVQGMVQGGIATAFDMTGLSSPFSGIGGLIGGALGAASPIPGGAMLGGALGQAVMSPLDALNPINFQMQELQRANYFGRNAEQNAFRHLRGMGQGLNRGSFSLQEQSKIGVEMAKMYNRDLTYSSEDISGFQQQFAQTGQFLGVETATQYTQRMKVLMSNLEGMSKTLQMANEDAIRVMDKLYSDVGFNHGSGMNMMRSRIYASAHLSGATPQEMIDVMTRGAGMGGQYGMLNRTGSQGLLAATALSGISASTNMPTSILASVGGEQGLADLIAKSNLQMAGGASGSLMALLGGNYGTDLVGAMGRGTAKIGGTSDLISILTGKHHMMDKMTPEQMQLQNTSNAVGFAKMFESVGGTKEQRMQMYFMQQGHSPIEAEALVKASLAQGDTLKRQLLTMGQERGDLAQDQMIEHNSTVNSLRLKFRDTMMGEGSILGGVSSASATAGDVGARYAQAVGDKWSGFGERRLFGEGTLGAADAAVDELRFKTRSSSGKALNRFLSDGGSSSKIMRSEILDAVKTGDRRKIRSAIAAAKEGGRYTSASMMHMVGEESRYYKEVTEEEIQDAKHQVNATDIHASLTTDKKASKYLSQKERVEAARNLFGGIAGVDPSELDFAVSDPSFSKAVSIVEELYDSYDESKVTQSESWYQKQESLSQVISKMDSKVQKIFTKIIQDKGLRLEGTKVSGFESGFNQTSGEKLSEDLFSKTGFFKKQDKLDFWKNKMSAHSGKDDYYNKRKYNEAKKYYGMLSAEKASYGTNVKDFLGTATSSKAKEQRNTAISRSLQGMGISTASLEDNANFDENLSRIINSSLGSIDPENVNLGNEEYNSYIRDAIKFQKSGGVFTEESGRQIMKVLASANLGSTIGESFTGERNLAMEQAKMMKETSETMSQTAHTLLALQKVLEDM